jgi:hypothetical protein
MQEVHDKRQVVLPLFRLMLIDDLVEEQKLLRARNQPNLWFTSFPIADLLHEVRMAYFPHLNRQIDYYAVNRGPLACITILEHRATIFFHQILNHGDTPADVVRFICKHELLHLQISTAEVNGRKTAHPPEFWEAEKRIAPERGLAWNWIWVNLGLCIKRRPKLERIDVLPNWRLAWALPKANLGDCVEMCRRSPVAENEEAGW